MRYSYRYDQFGNMWYRVGWGGSFGSWLEENPSFTNNKRNDLTYDAAGNLFGNSTVSYDATGQQISYAGETSRSSNAAFQPHRFTTYTRDADGGDDAMMRRYGNYWARFSQPDPWGEATILAILNHSIVTPMHRMIQST